MRERNSFFFGLVLIAVGAVLLLGNLGITGISFRNFWPLIILAVGLSFELDFFFSGRKNPGMLVPGGILITIGVIFIICVFAGWHRMSVLWPLFILAPAVGLFQLYLFGPRNEGLPIPVVILSVVGLTFLSLNLGLIQNITVIFGILMICLGGYILFKR